MPVSAFGIFAGIMIFLLYIVSVPIASPPPPLSPCLSPCATPATALQHQWRTAQLPPAESTLRVPPITTSPHRPQENVLLMPATLAIYDRWSSTSPRPRHLRRLLGRIPALFRRPFPSARVSASEAPPPLPSGAPSPFDLPETRQEGEAAEAVREGPKRDLRWIERLFRDRWVPLCNRGKWPILTAFSALLVLGLVYMLQLAPPEEEDVWFPRSHIMQRGLDLVSSSSGVFSASDEDDAQPLLMVWGLKVTGAAAWSPAWSPFPFQGRATEPLPPLVRSSCCFWRGVSQQRRRRDVTQLLALGARGCLRRKETRADPMRRMHACFLPCGT